MADAKTFAEQFGKGEPTGGVHKDRQQTSRAFMLRLRFKSGRCPVAIAWAMFNDAEIEEVGGVERLTLLFVQRVVHITGRRLYDVLVDIETERVDEIEEMDEPSVALADSQRKAVISKIEVLPDLKARVAEILNRTENPYGQQDTGIPEH